MQLHETLHNCLVAVASRYPQDSVDIDEDIWGQQNVKLHAQTPLALLKELQLGAPQSLSLSARVESEASTCHICVVELSEERPAFRFHSPRQALLR